MSDLTELARRNQEAARRIHQRTARQRLRNVALRGIAALPACREASDRQTILLIRPDHLGDVLLTMPAVQALARGLPQARLVALVGPWSAGIVSAYPEIALTLTLPFPGFARNPVRTSPRPYWLAWQWARQVRRLHADTAIIFRPDHWWGAMLAKLAGVPRRIGFDLPDVVPFLTDPFPLPEGHAVERSMALVSPWVRPRRREQIALQFPVEELDRQAIRQKLEEAGMPAGAPRVIIHPGAGTVIKQWPIAHWALVADRLAAEWGVPIIFTGGDHEIQMVRAIVSLMRAPAVVMAGETSLFQLAALAEGARVMLGPDSGPLHLAVAVGTPTVHLYGPADPAEFGPWGPPHRHAVLTSAIGCRPCRILDWPGADPADHPCVRDILPERVIAAALEVTAGTY